MMSRLPGSARDPGEGRDLGRAAAFPRGIADVRTIPGRGLHRLADGRLELRSPDGGSTPAPAECGRSRETTTRSDLAGWAEYDYCASHRRFFRGLRLHLLCTMGGLPIMFALTGAKADERGTLQGMLDNSPEVTVAHPRQTIVGDKNYFGREFERDLTERELKLLRPARKGEPERAGAALFKPLRQVIESINQTFKGRLDLERHGGRTPAGVIIRVLSRILAITAAIWHNDRFDQPVKRSLIAYDH